jgi:hypothetical protein
LLQLSGSVGLRKFWTVVHYSASFEFLDVFALKNYSESHGEPTHGGEIRRGAFQSVDLCRLTVRQQSARLDAERCRDDGGDQSTRRGIDGAGPSRPAVPSTAWGSQAE